MFCFFQIPLRKNIRREWKLSLSEPTAAGCGGGRQDTTLGNCPEYFDQQTSFDITDNEVTLVPPDKWPLRFAGVFGTPGPVNHLQNYDPSRTITAFVIGSEVTGLGKKEFKVLIKAQTSPGQTSKDLAATEEREGGSQF